MNILEEFWYGNIEPVEYDTSSSKEYEGAAPVNQPERGQAACHHDR